MTDPIGPPAAVVDVCDNIDLLAEIVAHRIRGLGVAVLVVVPIVAAPDIVRSGAADQRVAAWAADEQIVAGGTVEHVVAGQPVQAVVAGPAYEFVLGIRAFDEQSDILWHAPSGASLLLLV